MQVVGQVPDVVCEHASALLQHMDVLPQGRAPLDIGQALLDAAEGDGQSCQLLTDVVVQVTGDPRALGVLGLDQPAGQVLNLPMTRLDRCLALVDALLGGPSFGDVDTAADVADQPAVGAEAGTPESRTHR